MKSSTPLLFSLLFLCSLVSGQKLKDSSLYSVSESFNSTPCPTWTYRTADNQSCQCGNILKGIINCNNNDGHFEVQVMREYCVTLDNNMVEEVVGACIINLRRFVLLGRYVSLPPNVNQLDEICLQTNRTGQLCGKCQNGTSFAVYSYTARCVPCPAGTNNWLRYIGVSLGPTSLFLLVLLALRFKATVPSVASFIIFCQLISAPPILRLLEENYYAHPYYGAKKNALMFFINLGTMWNLDFFRVLNSPFCLHPNAQPLEILALDYIIAFYPLTMILITYVLVTLHYYDCSLVVWLWKPFRRCFIRFRKEWNIQNSLVDAFATFLLLSYVKLLSVSFDILMPTILVDKWGKYKSTMVYYDGNVAYFRRNHYLYAILAIAILIIFIFLPIFLLCLYPCRCFQRFLNRHSLRSQILHTFVEIFQGNFKDGTNGTRDCRYFAAFYLIVRIVGYMSLGFDLVSLGFITTLAILLIITFLVSACQPYKKRLYNAIDIFFTLNLSIILVCGLTQINGYAPLEHYAKAGIAIFALVSLILYIFCHVAYSFFMRLRITQSGIRKLIRELYSIAN